MDNCPICHSQYRDDIDNMLSKGAEIKYIQSWCKERNFQVTQKQLKQHRHLHLNQVEKVEVEWSNDPIYLNLSSLEDKLKVERRELQAYFTQGNLPINQVQEYDAIAVMQYVINKNANEVTKLKLKLKKSLGSNSKDKILALKNKKLRQQIRFQKAVAASQEIKLNQLEGKLVKCEQLEEKWSYSLVGFKAKLESIPNKVALELSSVNEPSDVEKILNKLIEESLAELENGS